jgi:hypothetical protein
VQPPAAAVGLEQQDDVSARDLPRDPADRLAGRVVRRQLAARPADRLQVRGTVPELVGEGAGREADDRGDEQEQQGAGPGP